MITAIRDDDDDNTGRATSTQPLLRSCTSTSCMSSISDRSLIINMLRMMIMLTMIMLTMVTIGFLDAICNNVITNFSLDGGSKEERRGRFCNWQFSNLPSLAVCQYLVKPI